MTIYLVVDDSEDDLIRAAFSSERLAQDYVDEYKEVYSRRRPNIKPIDVDGEVEVKRIQVYECIVGVDNGVVSKTMCVGYVLQRPSEARTDVVVSHPPFYVKATSTISAEDAMRAAQLRREELLVEQSTCSHEWDVSVRPEDHMIVSHCQKCLKRQVVKNPTMEDLYYWWSYK